MPGRVSVVVGGTLGIGRATALALGEAGAHLVVLGRHEDAGAAVVSRLRRRGARAEFLRTDLSDPESIRQTATKLRRRHRRIDTLVNNAGARFSRYETSGFGVERTFAVNHLGHFLLTALLLDRLLESKDGRIVTIGSGAHAASLDSGWLPTENGYDRKVAYAVSKLANVTFTYELARRLRGTSVTANSIDPGGVATNLGRNNGLVPWLRHLVYYGARGELKTARRAASLVTRVATDESLRGVSGKYFDERGEIQSTAISTMSIAPPSCGHSASACQASIRASAPRGRTSIHADRAAEC